MFVFSGQHETAIETLVQAISIIKQSPVAGDETSQVGGMPRDYRYFKLQLQVDKYISHIPVGRSVLKDIPGSQ